MRKKLFLIANITLLIFASCKVRMYTSANYGSIKNHVEKPRHIDGEDVAKNYVSLNANCGEYEDDGNIFKKNTATEVISPITYGGKQSLTFDAYRSHTTKNFNFYYGIGYTYGRYNFKSPIVFIKENSSTIDTLSLVPKNKIANFHSANAKIGGNVRIGYDDFEIRLIGLEFIYAHEFGDYINILKKIPTNTRNMYVIKENPLFSYNFYSEWTYNIDATHKATLGVYLGGFTNIDTPENSYIRTSYGGFNLAYTYKKNTFYFVRESANILLSSIKIGFARQL